MQIRKQNIFNTTWAIIKFSVAWLYVCLNALILAFIPRGKLSVKYMQIFMRQFNWFMGVRFKIKGKLVSKRPLLCVCNHISVFEISTMAASLGGSFFAKKDIESWPLIGWMAKKFGVVFIDRRPSHALEALNAIKTKLELVENQVFFLQKLQIYL